MSRPWANEITWHLMTPARQKRARLDPTNSTNSSTCVGEFGASEVKCIRTHVIRNINTCDVIYFRVSGLRARHYRHRHKSVTRQTSKEVHHTDTSLEAPVRTLTANVEKRM